MKTKKCSICGKEIDLAALWNENGNTCYKCMGLRKKHTKNEIEIIFEKVREYSREEWIVILDILDSMTSKEETQFKQSLKQCNRSIMPNIASLYAEDISHTNWKSVDDIVKNWD